MAETQRGGAASTVLSYSGYGGRDRSHRNFVARQSFWAQSLTFAPPPPTPPAQFTAPLLVPDAEDPNAFLGIDVGCITDVASTFDLASGLINLGMALLRRLSTPKGGLFYDLDYGLDLRDYLNLGVNQTELDDAPEAIRHECEKDDRVQSASVDVAFTRASGTMTVTIRGRTAVGPFSLIIGVSQLTIALLGLTDTESSA